MRSDHGLQWVAVGFERFLEYLGIQHRKVFPYCPQINGKVERFNETMKSAIRIAAEEIKPWNEELEKFLFQHRTTHRTVMVVGRNCDQKLPTIWSGRYKYS